VQIEGGDGLAGLLSTELLLLIFFLSRNDHIPNKLIKLYLPFVNKLSAMRDGSASGTYSSA